MKKNEFIKKRGMRAYLRYLEKNASINRERYYENPRVKKSMEKSNDKRKKIAGNMHLFQKWNKPEINFLKKNHKKMNILNIAIELERSLESIYCKASRLRLHKNHKWI